jgi:hypothetical protein
MFSGNREIFSDDIETFFDNIEIFSSHQPISLLHREKKYFLTGTFFVFIDFLARHLIYIFI